MVQQLKDITTQIFKGKFIAFFSVLVTIFAFVFLYKIAFIPAENLNEHAGVIVGFVTAQVLSNVIGYWFGAKKEKDE